MEWREDALPPATPTSQCRARKKTRAQVEAPRTPMAQPNFQALHVTPVQQRFPASDVFQTPQPTNRQLYNVPQTQAPHIAPHFMPVQQGFPASNVF